MEGNRIPRYCGIFCFQDHWPHLVMYPTLDQLLRMRLLDCLNPNFIPHPPPAQSLEHSHSNSSRFLLERELVSSACCLAPISICHSHTVEKGIFPAVRAVDMRICGGVPVLLGSVVPKRPPQFCSLFQHMTASPIGPQA